MGQIISGACSVPGAGPWEDSGARHLRPGGEGSRVGECGPRRAPRPGLARSAAGSTRQARPQHVGARQCASFHVHLCSRKSMRRARGKKRINGDCQPKASQVRYYGAHHRGEVLTPRVRRQTKADGLIPARDLALLCFYCTRVELQVFWGFFLHRTSEGVLEGRNQKNVPPPPPFPFPTC